MTKSFHESCKGQTKPQVTYTPQILCLVVIHLIQYFLYTASWGPDTDMSKVTMSGIPLTCSISNEAMH